MKHGQGVFKKMIDSSKEPAITDSIKTGNREVAAWN